MKILILDDFGLRNYSHREATILYEILEDRYRKNSLIVTSQMDPRGWKSLIEDKVIAELYSIDLWPLLMLFILKVHLLGEIIRKKGLKKV